SAPTILSGSKSATAPVVSADPRLALVSRSQKPDDDTAKQTPDGLTGKPGAPKVMLPINYNDLPEISETQPLCRIRATVNGMPILDEEIREMATPYLMQTLSLP